MNDMSGMKRFPALALFAAVMLFIITPGFAESKGDAKPDPDAILRKIDDLWRGDSSWGVITMKVKTAHWERSLTMEIWSEGTERTLVRVLKPLKEKGTATLKVGNEIYNYLPKTDRTIKLTAAMMMGSWMGSHFTNDDLVKENRMSDDYSSKVTFTGLRDGVEVVDITLTPKHEAAVVWGKVIVVVRAGDTQPLSLDYFDEEGQVARRMMLSDHRKISGRLLPVRMRMVPSDKPGEYTEIVYEKLEFDKKIRKGFFSLDQLRR